VDHKKVTSSAAERLLKSSRENSEKGGQEWKISNEAHCIYPVPSTRCLKDYNCTERDTKRQIHYWLNGINANEMANTKKKDIIAMSPKKIELNFSP